MKISLAITVQVFYNRSQSRRTICKYLVPGKKRFLDVQRVNRVWIERGREEEM